MSHSYQQSEGIILRAIPFRDYDHILTLFTPTGVMKLVVYGSRSKRRGVQGLCVPLTKVSIVFRETGGEMYTCQEISLVDPYARLRQELHQLEGACDLLHAVSASQWVGKPAPHLYALLCFFLERIPESHFPASLAVCFRLKLLKHEGLAAFPFVCSACGQVLLAEAHTLHAEGWCMAHRPVGSVAWSQKSLELIYRLAVSQSYREICTSEVSPQLQSQVIQLFDDCYEVSHR